MIEQYIYQVFEATGSSLYTFNYSNEYILFLETDRLSKCLYIFEQLGKKHAPLLRIGVGHSAPLSHQHLSYRSAKTAVNSLFANESLAVFDHLDLEILLGNLSDDTKNFYTADQLYLHKNTLQYQLDRIGKTTGYNPRSFKDAALLYIGLKLMANEGV